MPVVTINPVNAISVRVNQSAQTTIPSTTQFIGGLSNEVMALANAAFTQANTALVIAQSAYNNSNTKLSLSGGTITGNLTVSGTFNNANTIVDAGTF